LADSAACGRQAIPPSPRLRRARKKAPKVAIWGLYSYFPVSPDLQREAIKMYRIGTADIGSPDTGF